jgi:metal-dependent HD superfamily phosphatase/phosphodiesterase
LRTKKDEGGSEALGDAPVTVDMLREDPQVEAFLKQTDENLRTLGYTEHGEPHASWTSETAGRILESLVYPPRVVELAEIAGYLHDIGNLVLRENHAHVGALIAMEVLTRLNMGHPEVALVMGAVGNHEEERGQPVSAMAAATIIADKADVRRSRVRNKDHLKVDIHDRVNYAARSSSLVVDAEKRTITLDLEIETEIAPVIEYFEIFLERMLISKLAARALDCDFSLVINGTRM